MDSLQFSTASSSILGQHPQAMVTGYSAAAASGHSQAATGESSKSKVAVQGNAAPTDGPVKPKQSKSRNGCVTCKGKRLKCDETKPTCQQCAKRGVECGGYKKDFKWRSYEETQLSSKAPKQPRKSTGGITKTKKVPPPLSNAALNVSDASLSALSTSLSPFSPTFGSPSAYETGPQFPFELFPQDVPPSAKSEGFDLDSDQTYMISQDGSLSPPTHRHRFGHHSHASQSSIDTLSGTVPVLEMNQSNVFPTISVGTEMYHNGSPTIKQEDVDDNQLYNLAPIQPSGGNNVWTIEFPSPAMSNHSSTSSESFHSSQALNQSIPLNPADPEVIFLNFDRATCGIMSIKNGPTENPWRTLIWPLAQENPALYHALSAMTAFHMSRQSHAYRVQGVEHVRKSLHALSTGIGNGSMSDEAALATTLVLAFSEAFDRHITTGTEHLKGAKILINRTLAPYQQGQRQWGDNLRRLKFLHNVWVYLDVLARLTSDNDDDEIPNPAVFGPASLIEEIDPLMGCASTLFPLIGRVANLVRKVRRCNANNLSIITEAMELKSLIENWVPAQAYHPLEDRSTEMVHCLKTAEAYQYATLLFLHQAVPEVPSLSSQQLSKKVLSLLASIPITSGACIVHIYPLLAAGCEAATPEEREWVNTRWEQMSARMWIGNVDSAWEVVKQVWSRRDEHKAAEEAQRRNAFSLRPPYSNATARSSSLPRTMSGNDAIRRDYMPFTPEPEDLTSSLSVRPHIVRSSSEGLLDECSFDGEEDVTVRSKLHWVGVMKDWGWEVLLG